MKKLYCFQQSGIGLIEVLVTATVIAVGLLVVAAKQGDFMSSSGELKARAEAIKLAEAKIEELRNMATRAHYTALASSTGPESISGINATFSRSWTVTTPTTPANGPNRRNVAVTVTWGAGGADETVNLVSQIAWADTGKATDYATGGNGLAGKAPSPNNISSVVSNMKFKSSQISETAMGASGLTKYTDSDGNIYLLKAITPDAQGNNRQAVIKFQGGIVLSISGSVYQGSVGSGNNPSVTLTPTTAYPIAFSDLAYCVFPVPGTASDYICYFGGDCTLGGAGCPASGNYQAVYGGWYGKVGLTETSSANFQNKKVCFGEDVAGTGIETATTTARQYITRRINASNNVIGSEGINQSFACQNFLVVSKRGSSYPCDAFQNYTIPGTSNKLAIGSSSIERVLGPGQSNLVQAEETSRCGATSRFTITGTITGAQRDQVKVVADNQACLISISNNVFTYICAIETTKSSITVRAYGGGVSPGTQNINLTQASITGATLVTGGATPPSDCTAPWGAVVTNGSSVTAYQAASVPAGSSCVSETRTCNNGSLSGSYAHQSCTVQAVSNCTVTVSGTIQKGSVSGAKNVTHNQVTVTANGTSCTKNTTNNNLGSYTCNAGSLVNGSSVAISGNNVTGGGSVTVNCQGQSSVTITGPTLTTTN